ncbi:MAG: SIMPL domain-containing protein [Phycisphaeraceae bacterium]|nr:SIMPL domain-containing protein [Phycisphaeraceae bacterium]
MIGLAAGVMGLAAMAGADVELRGKSAELRAHLSATEGLVDLSGSAEVKSDTDEAVVALAIVSKQTKLKDAMEANYRIRTRLINFLKTIDVADDRVKTSRFSSTPNAGLFSKTASYTVHNAVSVLIKSEKKLHAIAGFVDANEGVSYGGVTFRMSNRRQLIEKATLKAIEDLKKRKAMYEKQFGVKLQLVRFSQPRVSGGHVQHYRKLYQQQKYPNSSGLRQSASVSRGLEGQFAEVEHFSEIKVRMSIGARYRIAGP